MSKATASEQGQPRPVLVKVGGSLITQRGNPCVPDDSAMARIADAVAAVDRPLVICHGLGSYGRAVLPLYEGYRIPGTQAALARRVQRLLAELNERFLDHLMRAGAPMAALDPGSVFAFRDMNVCATGTDVFHAHLQHGRIPMIHGGTFLDVGGDYVIVSSDRITMEIACALQVDRVVWASDVDGVFDQLRQPMAELRRADVAQMWRPKEVDADPSGAMHGKVREALRLAEFGIDSFVVNGNTTERLRDALRGLDVAGTRIPAVVASAG